MLKLAGKRKEIVPFPFDSRSGAPEPCAQHVHGLRGVGRGLFHSLIFSRVEASTKPGAIHIYARWSVGAIKINWIFRIRSPVLESIPERALDMSEK